MAVDSGTWGVEHWGLVIGIASLVATLLISLPQLLLQWRQDSEKHLTEDPLLRAEWAARLRSGSAGAAYRDAMARTLAWLDRVFGAPGSLRALGVCFLIALAYAWGTFFLGYGFLGAPGDIAGLHLLPDGATQPARAIFAAVVFALPPVMFIVTRWLARSAGAGEEWAERRYCEPWLRHRSFRIAYWLLRLIVVGGVVGLILSAATFPIAEADLVTVVAGAAFFLTPYFGARISCRVGRYFSNSLVRMMAAWLAAAGAMLLAFPAALLVITIPLFSFVYLTTVFHIDFVVDHAEYWLPVLMLFITLLVITPGKPFAAGRTAALVFYVAVASLIQISALPVGNDVAAGNFSTVTVAVSALAGGVGAAVSIVPCYERKVLWLGAFCGYFSVLLLPVAVLFLADSTSVDNSIRSVGSLIFILFFLVLPVANSPFDWLSWWTTRVLGRRLLAVLDPAQGFWTRLTAVLAHGLADLAAAVALLLLMAFALGLGFQVYNDLAILRGATPPFDLSAMIDAVALHPWTEGFWITLMLLTTLLPTIGHGVMLLGSPLGLMLIPDRKRLALADDLDGYATAGDRQPSICRRAARWHVQERTVGWVLGAVLLGWLLTRVGLLYPLGLAGWVASAAHAGVRAAGYLVGIPSA